MGLTEFAEFTSGVEGRVEEGPGDLGDAGSAILFPTWLQPPPPPLTGLDRQERAPVPNGALQRWGGGGEREREKGGEGCHQFRVAVLCLSTLVQTELSTPRRWTAISITADTVSRGGVLMVPWMFPSLAAAGAEAILLAPNARFSKIILILLCSGRT